MMGIFFFFFFLQQMRAGQGQDRTKRSLMWHWAGELVVIVSR